MILGTAGHIDHGKTSLVKALTGVDTDRLPEEKKRGITIDLGFAPLHLDDVGTVGIVDVPGHEGFVRTMLAGATGINLGLLVVAADEGVMPQTLEHLEILRILGVPVPVVALTKCDLVEADWLALASAEVEGAVRKAMGTTAQIVPVSAVTGDGIQELKSALAREFAQIAELPRKDLFRMPVDRVFTIRGTGTVVSGTIWSGVVRAGDQLRVLPGGKDARIRRVESHGHTVDECSQGMRCAIAVSNLSVEEISRGDVLVGGAGWRPTVRFAANVRIDSDFLAIVRKGRLVQLHIGAAAVPARLRISDEAGEAGSIYAMISLKEPVVARAGDRFVLRSQSPVATIGGGVVLDPFPARGSIRERVLEEADALKLGQLLRFAGSRGIRAEELPIRLGVSPDECTMISSGMPDVLLLNEFFYSEQCAAVLQEGIGLILEKNEVNDPLTRGVSLSTARMTTRGGELFDLVVRRMSDRGDLVVEDGLIRRTNWVPSLDENARKLADSVLHDICASLREPPSVGDLVRKRGDRVPELLRFIAKEGKIVQVETDRYFDSVVVEELIRELQGQMTGGRVYTPSELRDFLGVSRKYLIPFLEYCDRQGVTERRSNGRVLLRGG